jgi:hypothetical protein
MLPVCVRGALLIAHWHAHHDLPHDNPEAIDIALRVNFVVLRNFWSHEEGGALADVAEAVLSWPQPF